jgi:Polyketide cyclase / dehydrase and lipid transport
VARAYASAVIKAPIETVWSLIRNFNGLPVWVPMVVDSKIEAGLDSDVVGCVRSIHTNDGKHVRQRLLTLDDAQHTFAYNFETPAYPIKNYIATVRLMPVTHTPIKPLLNGKPFLMRRLAIKENMSGLFQMMFSPLGGRP